jgi:hypothetical protein
VFKTASGTPSVNGGYLCLARRRQGRSGFRIVWKRMTHRMNLLVNSKDLALIDNTETEL